MKIHINAQYLSVEESNSKLTTCDSGSFFSILHVNIRSMRKNFEKFKLMLRSSYTGIIMPKICL